MKRVLSMVLCTALLTGLLAGCGSSGSSSSSAEDSSSSSSAAGTDASVTTSGVKTLRVAWSADMQTMDVHKTSANYSIPINVFDRLFEIKQVDGNAELVPSLVEDYTVSDDGLTYDFTLRSGVTFSDGTPLTANDVKFTFTRMLALPDSLQTGFADMISGADAVMSGESEDLAGITVTDDTHFSITLSEPYAAFISMLATPSCSIMSEANVTAAGDSFGQDPAQTIGSGPYIVSSWSRDSEIVLDANPNYWGEAPDVQKVIISIVPDVSTMSMMFQSGQIDILDCSELSSAVVDSTYRTQYADQIVEAQNLATTYLIMNENIEPLNNVDVRKAIQMAIDRESILQSVYSGDGTIPDGIYPQGLIGYTEDNQGWLQYDPEGAKALLAEAGYPDGFTMEIAADNSASDSVLLVIQIIQQNLADVGITLNITNYDEAAWLDLRNSGEMPSFVATWTADFNDPDNFIYTFFGNAQNSKQRSINYSNTAVMEEVAAARSITDEAERLAEYAALERQIVETDAAWVPLLSTTHLFVIGDNVESYTPHWAGYSDYAFSGVTLKS